MSHLKERSEKNCLNCNAQVHGRYCHICGQENIETFETAWHLIKHFFQDITHFDGKFFSTLKYLLFKPGFISREYMIGRRASYLNPIRMYVFTSAIFFLIFFSLIGPPEKMVSTNVNGKSIEEVDAMDSTAFSAFSKTMDEGVVLASKEDFHHYLDSVNARTGIHFSTKKYHSMQEYDSLVKKGIVKDGWMKRMMVHREIEINEKYHNDQNKVLQAFVMKLLHSFPQMLFISLPFFALFLKLLYIRRKRFYYGSHAIFGIHFYVFIFIASLFSIMLVKLGIWLDWSIFDYLAGLMVLVIFYYEYKAMRIFYEQGRAKTILKFFILNLLHLLLNGLLIIIFIIFSLMKF